MFAPQKIHVLDLCRELATTIRLSEIDKMSWMDFLTERKKIDAIFGDVEPHLNSVELHEVSLNRDGPKVILRFDFSEFPIFPPKKWGLAGFNRVQIQLIALGIDDLNIQGWGTACTCSISIFAAERGGVSLIVDESDFKIRLKASFLVVGSLSAYSSLPEQASR